MTAPKPTSRRRPDGPPSPVYNRPEFTYRDRIDQDAEVALAYLLDAVLYASREMVTPTMRMLDASANAASLLAPSHRFSGPDAAKRALDQWVRRREAKAACSGSRRC